MRFLGRSVSEVALEGLELLLGQFAPGKAFAGNLKGAVRIEHAARVPPVRSLVERADQDHQSHDVQYWTS